MTRACGKQQSKISTLLSLSQGTHTTNQNGVRPERALLDGVHESVDSLQLLGQLPLLHAQHPDSLLALLCHEGMHACA